MRRFLCSRSFLLALGLTTTVSLAAPSQAQNQNRQTASPQTQRPSQSKAAPALDLVARDIRTDRAAVSAKSLTIANLDINIKIDNGLVETTLTARFTNPNEAVLEGDFTLDLPREAWVTGFALDVNGTLIDGVLQPKAKAAEAYEENLRRGVDPGLGEINAANQFRTRIFPINPRSGRTVKITYVSTLDATGTYTLPLTTAGPVGQVAIGISNQGNATPILRLPAGLRAINPAGISPNNAAGRTGFIDGYGQTVATVQGQNVELYGNLKLSNLGQSDGISVSTSRNGDQYFSFLLPPAPVAATKPKIVRLYWDSSRSRREDDLAKEITFLERYIAQTGPDQVDLILFADGAPRITSFNRASLGTLSAVVRDVRYQGASRFGDLDRVGVSQTGSDDADVCLVFSDGQLTMEAFSVRQWPCKVVTISTSINARRDILEGIAEANRGTFIDLKSATMADALAAMQTRGPDLRALTTNAGLAVDFTVNPTADGRFRITGPRPEANELVVRTYGGELRLPLQSAAMASHNGAAALWGVSQIKRLSATDNPDTDTLLAAVRRYGVATPDYSYLVLETVEDYARNNIAPSPTIGKDFLTQYQTRRTQIETAERAARDARLQAILAQWNEQKTWWKTRFAPQAQAKSVPNGNDNASPETRQGRLIERDMARQETSPPRSESPNALSPSPPPQPPPPPPPPPRDQEARASLARPTPEPVRTRPAVVGVQDAAAARCHQRMLSQHLTGARDQDRDGAGAG